MKKRIKLYHTLLVLGVTVAVVLLNLAVSTISDKLPLSADFTKNKVFELSEETKEVLKKVDRNVDIYYFVTKGKENLYISQTVDMYKGYSNKISFTQKDPAEDPEFTKTFGNNLTDNSIIVKCGDRSRTIDSSTFYDTTFQQQNIVSFMLEQRLTRAIDYVLGDADVNVMFTSGHEEIGYNILKTPLEDENANVSEINLSTADIPENVSVLYIAGPQRDFSSAETEKLDLFLKRGGSLNISVDYGNELPVLTQYFKEYWGVIFDNDIVLECDESKIFQNPYYIIPSYGDSDIVSDMKAKNLNVIWPNARSITLDEKPGVTYTDVLRSSDKSAIKAAGSGNLSYTAEEGDIRGSQRLAVTLEYVDYEKSTRTKIVASGTTLYAAQMFLSEASIANSDYVRSAQSFLTGDEISKISVTPKNVAVQYLTLTNAQKTAYTWIFGILPGVIVLGAGLAVWLRRRHL